MRNKIVGSSTFEFLVSEFYSKIESLSNLPLNAETREDLVCKCLENKRLVEAQIFCSKGKVSAQVKSRLQHAIVEDYALNGGYVVDVGVSCMPMGLHFEKLEFRADRFQELIRLMMTVPRVPARLLEIVKKRIERCQNEGKHSWRVDLEKLRK